MISCRNLTRRFGNFTAVDSLNLEVAEGAICAFLGPNGAGKSTTVKMLTGLLPPTSGTVEVCGLDVIHHALEVKRIIGVLPEDLGLFDDLTVEEHLLLTGSVYGISKSETKIRVAHIRFRVFPRDAQEDRLRDGPSSKPARPVSRRAV